VTLINILKNGILTDPSNYAGLVAHDGFGMSPLHALSSRGPLQHGETYLDYRLDARVGSLVFKLSAESADEMYSYRQSLLNLFAPQVPISLVFNLPYGTRQIDGYTLDCSMPWSLNDAWSQKIGLSIYCPDPSFYDPIGATSSFLLGGGSDSFTVPTQIPTGIGTSVIDQSNVVLYQGNWRDFPIIRIIGPITDCVITNQTTNDVIDFTGTSIAAGTWYEIDCRYAYKTVLDHTGTNQIDKLSDTSDLATFHLASTIETSEGNNIIRVTGSNVNSESRVDVNYFNRYLGN
jgi:hypothetical protein